MRATFQSYLTTRSSSPRVRRGRIPVVSHAPNLLPVFSSSVGTKLLVGATGLLLVAYMVLHLAGNVLIFLGRDIFNEYSHKLISNPLIVPVELALLLVLLLHIYKAVTMWMKNKAARPVGTRRRSVPATRAARASHRRR